MVGLVGMGAEKLPPDIAKKAVNIGQYLISAAEIGGSPLEGSTRTGAVLQNPIARRTVAEVLGAAYIDCWRLMYVNREAIDQAVQALIAQGELVGDEIKGLLDSVGLRFPDEADPYPEDMPTAPPSVAEEMGRLRLEDAGARSA
jgi:hypothetical protein